MNWLPFKVATQLIHVQMVDVHTVNIFLFRYKRILVIVSHSQDFLNGVCTNIIHMQDAALKYYGVC